MEKISNNNINLNTSGILLTGLRWVTGWLFFSAFWRRIILENKLDPDGLGYVGEKFNHFMPNAIIVKPMIEYLVTNPEFLHIFLIVFTILEALVGLGLLLGLFTRVSALGVFMLSLGILFGAGWLGTTCLDEWQIGVLGVIAGLVMMVSGSDQYSLDRVLLNRFPGLAKQKWFPFVGSGNLEFLNAKNFKVISISIAVFSLFLTLYTNQVFHGGLWGKLHNLSLKPHIVVSDIRYVNNENLSFSLYRDQGADTYGAFVTRISVIDEHGNIEKELNNKDLAAIPAAAIQNFYVTKVKTGKNSLIVPLGAKADVTIDTKGLDPGEYLLEVEDISGTIWNNKFKL